VLGTMLWRALGSISALTCLVAAQASAIPAVWTLDGVVFDDGGTATGFVVIDGDRVYDWSIITSAGPAVPSPLTYDEISGLSGYGDDPPSLVFTQEPAPPGPRLFLLLTGVLTGPWSSVSIDTQGESGEWTQNTQLRAVTAGSLTGVVGPVHYVSIDQGEMRVSAAAVALYETQIEVETDTTVVGLSVTPPGGTPVAMIEGEDAWEIGPDAPGAPETIFTSLAQMRAVFPEGSYVFHVDLGASSVDITVLYDVDEPNDFPDITFPAHAATGVDLQPTFTWECVGCTGSLFAWEVGNDAEDDSIWTAESPLESSSAESEYFALDPGASHTFRVALLSRMGDPYAGRHQLEADGSAIVVFCDYWRSNQVSFTTVEPVPSLSAGGCGILVAVVLAIGCRAVGQLRHPGPGAPVRGSRRGAGGRASPRRDSVRGRRGDR